MEKRNVFKIIYTEFLSIFTIPEELTKSPMINSPSFVQILIDIFLTPKTINFFSFSKLPFLRKMLTSNFRL